MMKSSSSSRARGWRGRRESDSQVFCHPNSLHALAHIDRDMCHASRPHHHHHTYPSPPSYLSPSTRLLLREPTDTSDLWSLTLLCLVRLSVGMVSGFLPRTPRVFQLLAFLEWRVPNILLVASLLAACRERQVVCFVDLRGYL